MARAWAGVGGKQLQSFAGQRYTFDVTFNFTGGTAPAVIRIFCGPDVRLPQNKFGDPKLEPASYYQVVQRITRSLLYRYAYWDRYSPSNFLATYRNLSFLAGGAFVSRRGQRYTEEITEDNIECIMSR